MRKEDRQPKHGSQQQQRKAAAALYLDLNLDEVLAIVHTNNTADHLGDDDHVSQVCLDGLGFLVVDNSLLGLAQTLHQVQGDVTTGESPSGARMEELHELGMAQVEEVVHLKTTVEEATEWLAPADWCVSLTPQTEKRGVVSKSTNRTHTYSSCHANPTKSHISVAHTATLP